MTYGKLKNYKRKEGFIKPGFWYLTNDSEPLFSQAHSFTPGHIDSTTN